jgi:drug/metabolite transporter (DMT)-like permease
VFFRSFFAIPVILIWFWSQGMLATGLRTRNPVAHFWRGLIGTSSMGLSFAGLGMLPLPEVTAIQYAAPILTVVFAAMFLGERVRFFRLASVVLGMTGVLIILWPRLGAAADGEVAAAEALGAMLVLMSATFAAMTKIFVAKLVQIDHPATVVFYFSVTASCLSLITLPYGWVMPTGREAGLLVLAGIAGGVGQGLLTSAYRHADATVIAPFDYFSMLLALVIGYFVFAEVPTGMMLTGAALVVLAGIVILVRERQLGVERARSASRQAMTPQG